MKSPPSTECSSANTDSFPSADSATRRQAHQEPVTTERRTLRCDHSAKNLDTVLAHHCKQLQRNPARPLRSSLPFLDRAFARVQVARKDWLAHVIPLTQLLDLLGRERFRNNEARFIETPFAPQFSQVTPG